MKNNYCVIMAGGIGSRFWPLSRTSKPKQFIDILGTGRTFLQQTFDRFRNICPTQNIYIATSENYKQLVLEQLPEINEPQVLCEPERKNTAPCVAYANFKIKQINPNAVIVVAPSDHLITKEEKFVKTIKESMLFACENDCLLTLGIKPYRPDTGYGYIQINTNKPTQNKNINKVKAFTEKPNLETAKILYKSQEYFWNSGIFIWSLRNIEKAMQKYLPEINALFNTSYDNEKNHIKNAFSQSPNISIDYGIMEKVNNVYVYAANFGWSDLGTWGALYEHSLLDANKNAITGKNIMLYDTQNCIIKFQDDKLVVLQGLNNFIITESDNMLLISRKEEEQKIRQIVEDIKNRKGGQYT